MSLAPAMRLESLPVDLLDLLKADQPEQDNLLDFEALEWVLKDDHGAESVLGDLPRLSVKAEHNVLAGVDFVQQPTSSGGDTHDTALVGAAEPLHVGLVQRSSFAASGGSGNASAVLDTGHDDVHNDEDDDGHNAHHPGHQPPRKKRTRNAEQMQQNRIAQQKYRERKKHEQAQLQNALDQLTAQLAVMKAMEASAASLQRQNTELNTLATEQASKITELTITVERQSTELTTAKQQVAETSALAQQQQKMILDQHNRLLLQEQVIQQLKGRLQEKMDDAFEGRDPKEVCQRMVAAVRSALEDATNVEGVQETLAKLPEPVITEICKGILCEVKHMWPELAHRWHQHAEKHGLQTCVPRCGQEVQWSAAR